ncbi:MAG: hypothetical protein HPY62_00200 [Bacteroidales bacterium]|nr:hypothetical protein [Bacteroidales bacterium]
MKARPIILAVITLIIGFVLGMLTSAQLRYQKLKPVRLYFSEERFREGFYRIIQPDEAQKAKIDQVLDKYAKINGTLQNNFRKELEANMKEFRKELDSNLTKEQIARLKEIDERRDQMIREAQRNQRRDTSGRGRDPRYRPDFRHREQNPPPPPGFDRSDSSRFFNQL